MTADPGTTGAPVCPRHPDRVAYVRCQRCGRPTCPQCQRQAPVGIQCVDCVAQAAKAVPVQRTVFGGQVRGGRPVATYTFIVLCVASFVLQQVSSAWTTRWVFVPALGTEEPVRFLSSAFLHSPSQYTHIIFNMLALFMVGPYLESTLGRARFVSLYLLSALGGSVGALLFANPYSVEWVTGMYGASGAIFGLFGAVLVVLRRLGNDARGIVVIIAINAVLGFVVPGIAWEAHLGGLVVGLALGAAYAYAPRERRRQVAIGATVVTALVLVGLAWLKYASVPGWFEYVGG